MNLRSPRQLATLQALTIIFIVVIGSLLVLAEPQNWQIIGGILLIVVSIALLAYTIHFLNHGHER